MLDNLNLGLYDVKAALVIAGNTIPVSFFELLFRLDDIPMAYIEIPIGAEFTASGTATTGISAGSQFAQLVPLTPLQVYITIDKKSASATPPSPWNDALPIGNTKIFDGFILSPWQRRRRDGVASLAVTAMGYVGGLAATTQFVNSIMKDDLGVLSKTINITLGAEQVKKFVYDAMTLYPADSLGLAIQNLFNNISKLPVFNGVTQLSAICQNVINSFIDWGRISQISINSAGTALAGGGTVGASDFRNYLNSSVRRELERIIWNDWASTFEDGGGDLWTVLLLIARSFAFHIVPTIDASYLAPVLKAQGGKQFATISKYDLWFAELGQQFQVHDPSITTQVALYSSFQQPQVASADKGSGTSLPYLGFYAVSGFGGSDTSPQQLRMKLFEAPGWLIAPEPKGYDAANPGGNVPDSANPEIDLPLFEHPEKIYYSAGLGNAYAQYLLYELMFQQRVMSVTGRLRFDIAPGSLVRVEMPSDMSTASNAESAYLYGSVFEVRIKVGNNGNKSFCQTTVTMTNVRTEAEQSNDIAPGFVITAHPIYSAGITNGFTLLNGITPSLG